MCAFAGCSPRPSVSDATQTTQEVTWSAIPRVYDEQVEKALKCKVVDSQSFVREGDSQRIDTYVASGAGRYIGLHDPGWCFAKLAKLEREQAGDTMSIGGIDFANGVFVRGEDLERLRIFWSYYVDGRWQVADQPMALLGGKDVARKLYLITDADQGSFDEAVSRLVREYASKVSAVE